MISDYMNELLVFLAKLCCPLSGVVVLKLNTRGVHSEETVRSTKTKAENKKLDES